MSDPLGSSAAAMQVTGVVLAGGLGRRMGGVDKGLQELDGRPMVAHVIDRLAAQVDEVLLNANQNLDRYASFGHRVVPDLVGGFAGPLAGLHRGLTEAAHPLVVTAPCDSPFLPADLVARLRAPIDAGRAVVTLARTGTQVHPVFALCRRDLLAALSAFLESGGRKIDLWTASLAFEEVAFDEDPSAFDNINTRAELAAAALGKLTR
ncbi:MAG: molybdenum cofactor guanylyltransferase [Proteobacteria bacterium]|nr:molybdenum cofactor guanylyltransferase [Burkholderiales bacterium]